MRHPWESLRGLPRSMWILAAATLVNRAGTMVIPFLVLYLTRGLGRTPSEAGMVIATYGATALVTGLFAGRLSDALGPRRLLQGALVGSSVVLLAFPLARSLPSVVAMTVLLALTSEGFRPASLAAISALVPLGRRRSGFTLGRLAVNLGMSVGPALGGFLAGHSFRWLFLVDGGTSLAAATVLIAARFDVPRPAAPAPSPTTPEAAAPPPRGARAWRDRRLLAVLAMTLPVAMVFFQHESAMALFLVRDLHLAESTYGLAFTLNTAIIVVCEVWLNSVLVRWPQRRVMALGALLVGGGFGALGLAVGAWSMLATVVVWTVGEMVLLPSLPSYVSELAPEGRGGEYMGAYSMCFSLAFALGPWAGNALLQHIGARPLWAVCFVAGVLSAALAARLPSPRDLSRSAG